MGKELKDYLYYEEENPSLKIYCGDCLEIMPLLPKVDLVVTSPPYGIGKEYETLQSLESLIKMMEQVITLSYKISKEDGQLTINFQDPFIHKYHIGSDYAKFAREAGYEFSANRIWKKDPAWMNSPWISCSNYPVLEWEYIWTFSKKNRPLRKQFSRFANRGIWEFRSVKSFTQHPAEYPIGLPKRVMEVYTEDLNTILDPFLGSGTTLVAAKELGRNGIGIEINEKYCKIAATRLKNTQKMML